MRLLLERVSNENAELVSRERTARQQRINMESLEVTTSSTSDAQDQLQVVLLCLSM